MLAMLRLTVLVAFFGAVGFTQSSVPCTATTPIEKQSRTKMKHRTPPFSGTATAVTVSQMLAWKAPALVASSAAVRKSNNPIDPKERRGFTLDGDLWRILTDANDCDFHMELSAPDAGPNADRVIVEVPDDPPFQATRQILKQLADRGVAFPAPLMKKPIRVMSLGLRFTTHSTSPILTRKGVTTTARHLWGRCGNCTP